MSHWFFSEILAYYSPKFNCSLAIILWQYVSSSVTSGHVVTTFIKFVFVKKYSQFYKDRRSGSVLATKLNKITTFEMGQHFQISAKNSNRRLDLVIHFYSVYYYNDFNYIDYGIQRIWGLGGFFDVQY